MRNCSSAAVVPRDQGVNPKLQFKPARLHMKPNAVNRVTRHNQVTRQFKSLTPALGHTR